ncbi:TPA: TrmB family transcriptional regulator [Candidatus Woesearchaeota archaeon]|nr:TrmB family transcriptional regulator [Candidatus Woesearchaeota archaeon]HII68443.1 TrmB family transcriptional regulator [Candidatus Woesearchaeota archaeon]
MTAQQQLIGRLKEDFRLNIYEVKVWTSLLSRGIAAAGELADISGVPRSRCYDVLESLEKKGFIIMKIGKPIRYIAVPPEEIVDRVKKQTRKEVDVQLSMLDEIRATDIFRELELLYKTGIDKIDFEDITNFVSGRSAINAQVRSMIEGARQSIIIATTPEGVVRKMKILKKLSDKLNKGKVAVTLASAAAPDDALAKLLSNFSYKPLKGDARFVITDDEDVLFMLSPEEAGPELDAAVWVKSQFFGRALAGLLKGHVE